MSFYVDVKYLKMISSRLEGFTQKSSELWNCRCPLCGDSSKKSTKKRGFFYKKGDGLLYKCHNCGTGSKFLTILKQIDPSYVSEYTLEQFNTKEPPRKKAKPSLSPIVHKKPVFGKKDAFDIPRLSNLTLSNIARQYVEFRQIPEAYYKDLYYAEDFKKFVGQFSPGREEVLAENDKRLIIPFKDKYGSIIAIQGRTLTESKIRYITIKKEGVDDKFFGIDKVDLAKPVFVCEGPIDSMFLDNCIATADSTLTRAKSLVSSIDKLVLVYDNEPRNKEIVKQVEQAIEQNFKVCLFPTNYNFKDINEAILGGLTKHNIMDIINKNTFSDMRAKLEFINWKKC